MIMNELLKVREEGDHTAMSSGPGWRSQCSEMETVRGLLCSRRNLDPHLRTRRHGRIIGFRARTVVPVRLRRGRAVGVDRRRLHDDLRRVVVGRVVIRVTPPRTPPGTDYDDAVPMKVAVEAVVPVETVAAAMASASMTHCGA